MRILIVKTSALGDIIHTFPVLVYLKRRFSESKIDWVVEKEGSSLLATHPLVDRVITINSRQWRKAPFSAATRVEWVKFRKDLRQISYDIIFDLQGNVKSSLATFQARAKKKVSYGWKSVPEWPNCLVTNVRINPDQDGNVREEYLSIVRSFFSDKSSESVFKRPLQFANRLSDPIVAPLLLKLNEEEEEKLNQFNSLLHPNLTFLVCPGSNWPNKQLDSSVLETFLKKIEDNFSCYFLLAWGTEKEKELAESLQLNNKKILERLSLPLLQNLMSKVQLVIAMDSLPLHLAATTATPTFSVFGPSSAAKYAPKGDRHITYQGQCPYGRQFRKRCPILRSCPTGLCMKDITADQLYQLFATEFPLRSR